MERVVVVGGGLAGMVAALRLLERGYRVELYEASERLGGKAGTGLAAQIDDDHGYHIFPAWYLNIWQIVDELGIRDHFVDCEEFWQMRIGEYPRAHSFRNLSSIRYAWHNLRSGVLPVPQAFLFFYAALDLMSQPYSYRAQLDRVTVSGFLRSRMYRTEPISAQFEELMLKGISVPTYQVSAMTMRNAMRYWFRYPLPMHRILNGGLYDKWIAPLQRRIEDLGGKVHTGHRLERLELAGGALHRLWFRAAGAPVAVAAGQTILAIPCEKLWPLLDDEVIAAVPELARTRYLRSMPMAALNLYFDRPIQGMPKGHVNLIDAILERSRRVCTADHRVGLHHAARCVSGVCGARDRRRVAALRPCAARRKTLALELPAAPHRAAVHERRRRVDVPARRGHRGPQPLPRRRLLPLGDRSGLDGRRGQHGAARGRGAACSRRARKRRRDPRARGAAALAARAGPARAAPCRSRREAMDHDHRTQ
jgi:hypothetical protein